MTSMGVMANNIFERCVSTTSELLVLMTSFLSVMVEHAHTNTGFFLSWWKGIPAVIILVAFLLYMLVYEQPFRKSLLWVFFIFIGEVVAEVVVEKMKKDSWLSDIGCAQVIRCLHLLTLVLSSFVALIGLASSVANCNRKNSSSNDEEHVAGTEIDQENNNINECIGFGQHIDRSPRRTFTQYNGIGQQKDWSQEKHLPASSPLCRPKQSTWANEWNEFNKGNMVPSTTVNNTATSLNEDTNGLLSPQRPLLLNHAKNDISEQPTILPPFPSPSFFSLPAQVPPPPSSTTSKKRSMEQDDEESTQSTKRMRSCESNADNPTSEVEENERDEPIRCQEEEVKPSLSCEADDEKHEYSPTKESADDGTSCEEKGELSLSGEASANETIEANPIEEENENNAQKEEVNSSRSGEHDDEKAESFPSKEDFIAEI